LRQAERKVGQLTMENEILRAAAEKGASDPASEAAQIAMEHQLPVAVVCRVLGAPRSTIYARCQSKVPTRPPWTGHLDR
jgi:hypothetical protein